MLLNVTMRRAVGVFFIVQFTTSRCKSVVTQGAKTKSAAFELESKWLADEAFYDINPDDLPQGDQAIEEPDELCPPVPAVLPEGSCDLPACNSDRMCGTNGDRRKCCYNGCIYTCLPELSPPPLFDWVREPRRRLRSGLSWLITGPDRANQEEPCSTSPVSDDSDPLLCPGGYFCSIFDPGEQAKGLPNQGVCVKAAASEEGKDQMQADISPPDSARHAVTPGVHHHDACDLQKGQMLIEGHSVVLEGRHCVCRNRKLTCDDIERTEV